jgi:transcriptional regulator with AAA-type ATPase domain
VVPADTATTAAGAWPLGYELTASSAETDRAEIADRVNWLSFHRRWGQLPETSLQALAAALRPITVAADTDIFRQGQGAIGLYLLKWGSVEIYRPSPVGRTHIHYHSAGDLLGYLPGEGEHAAPYAASAIALSASELWFLPQAELSRLIHSHPGIQTPLNQLLALDLATFAQRIAWEELRIQQLQGYIRPVPETAPLIGTSKAAQKLAQRVATAAADLAPVVIQGAPGSGKTFVASLIHRQSGLRALPFAEVDCGELPQDASGIVQTDALFGRGEGRLGVLALLERGTLLLENVHRLAPGDRDRLVQYIQTGTVQPHGDQPPLTAAVRLVLASPQAVDWGQGLRPVHTLKLFSLTQRKDDIADLAEHFLDSILPGAGSDRRYNLIAGDLRRLISYAYPGNLHELAGILQRAVLMTPPDQTVIPEQVLWSVQSEKNAFRVDLLNQLPWLRQFLLSALVARAASGCW